MEQDSVYRMRAAECARRASAAQTEGLADVFRQIESRWLMLAAERDAIDARRAEVNEQSRKFFEALNAADVFVAPRAAKAG